MKQSYLEKQSQSLKWSALGLTALLALGIDCPRAVAAWSSIRANNRSPSEVRGGERRSEVQGRPAENRPNVTRPAEIERGREREAGRRVEIEHHERERRRLDIGRERASAYFWSGYRPGLIISSLPPGSVPIEVGPNPYYYYQGVYYENSPSGYVVATPPVGAAVGSLPPGAEAVAAGPNVYYYAGGSFYLPQPQGGFTVAPPPLGVTVNELPPGAVPITINGVLYYEAEGAYFLPVMEEGTTVYTTVQP